MCGADFPLKVAALGEGSPAISYSDDLRPPGSIPANSAQMPRWPINEPRYAPPAPVGSAPVQSAQTPNMRWVPGPSPAPQSRYAAPDQPISLSPPGGEPGVTPSAAPLPDDIPDDAVLPRGRAPATYSPQRAYGAPTYQPPQQRVAPSLWAFPSAANDGRCRSGDTDAGGHARLSDCVCTRPLGERRRATGGDALVWCASCRDQADLCLFMPRNGRVRWVWHIPNMLSEMPLTSRPSRWPTDDGLLFRKDGTARPKSRAFCTTCTSPRATISPPCWRPAITPRTTTTSMSI